MAFGDVLGSGTLALGTITTANAIPAAVNFAVAVGDLIFVAAGRQTSALGSPNVTDNLGNTYTILKADQDFGTFAGAFFYSRVTVAGTLTTVTVNIAAGSTNDGAFAFAGYAGPFVVSPLDADPAYVTADVSSPFTTSLTGTLAQADELIVSGVLIAGSTSWTASAPMSRDAQVASSTNIGVKIGHWVVSATTSVQANWTGSDVGKAIGIWSFKKAATGAFTLAADAGSYAYTGTAAGLRAARMIAAALGTYALTGQAMSPVHSCRIAAVTGAYALTGQAAALRAARKLAAVTGVYAHTGVAAGLRAGRKIAAETGAYVLTGVAADLVHGSSGVNHYTLSADFGVYAYTGTAARLAAGRMIAAAAGSYALTGQSAALRADRRMVADAGAYVLTGVDVTFTATLADGWIEQSGAATTFTPQTAGGSWSSPQGGSSATWAEVDGEDGTWSIQ